MTMKNAMKMNHAAYLSLSKGVESIGTQAAFLDTALSELCDGECEDFDLVAAGAILSGVESLVFQLRLSMFIIQNSNLPDDDGTLKDSILDLAVDICAMRDCLMNFLDEVFADSDKEFNEALTEAASNEDDVFYVRVPVESDVEIDGESYDFSSCSDDGGIVAIPIEPGEVLTVDGVDIDIDGCELGEVYSIIDGEGEDDDEETGDEEPDDELADNEFAVWVPMHSSIMVNGELLVIPEDVLSEEPDKDARLRLILCKGDTLTIDGNDVDLEDCKPGEDYDITAAD